MYKNIYCDKRNDITYVWDDEQGLMRYPSSDFRYAYRKCSSGTYKSMYGDSLEKIMVYSTDDPTLFEGDLNPEMRTLLDLYPGNEDVSKTIRILTYDIETDTSGGFPSIIDGNKAIIAIALYDHTADKYYSLILDELNKVSTVTHDNQYILPYKTEKELLTAFLNLWEDIKPDIILGWNNSMFDDPYIFNRIRVVLGKPAAYRLSPIRIAYQNQFNNKMTIAGISSLDYMELYKKFIGTVKPSYSLANVAKDEALKHQKITYRGNLNDLYESDINRFVEYNLVDIKIIIELDKKYDFVHLARSVCHKGRIPYEWFQMSSRFIDGAILDYLHQRQLIGPNKPVGGREAYEESLKEGEGEFEGAYVKPPVPGLYDWVCSADITSLYPSIIMSLNISPDTKIGKIEDWNYESFLNGTLSSINLNGKIYTNSEFKQLLENKEFSISTCGVVYQLKKDGVIPSILDKWFEERLQYRKKAKEYSESGNKEQESFYNRRQLRQKIFLNCFSPDTNVVTPTGIKAITELKVGDLVYSLNTMTGVTEIKPVIRTYLYDYTGDMIQFKSKHIDFLVTPNHRFWVSKLKNGHYLDFEWEYASDIYNESCQRQFPKISEFNVNIKNSILSPSDIDKIDYDGKVYCVEVKDNHTLLCGRNDKYQWAGQSVYGTLGLPIFRFYDRDNAESVTLTGQSIIKHTEGVVNGYFNEKLNTIDKDHVIYVDTDSVTGDCYVRINNQNVTLDELWDVIKFDREIVDLSQKHFKFPTNLELPYYDEYTKQILYGKVKYIERHKVNKNIFLIKTKGQRHIKVTEDHSIMIIDRGILTKKTPRELKRYDRVICLFDTIDEISHIIDLGYFNENFYDIGMEDTPHTFFANDILVHNSNYFSMKPMLDSSLQNDNTINTIISTIKPELNNICKIINDSYETMVCETCNIPLSKNRIRIVPDVIASKALWLHKKRYCLLKTYDMEKNKEVRDKDGNIGKLEAKGIDVVRSSFPAAFRIFAAELLDKLLRNTSSDILDEKIMKFYDELHTISIVNIAKTTSVKFISKNGLLHYNPANRTLFNFITGTPSGVKAALSYNDLLKTWKLTEQYDIIRNGQKVKWVWLAPNPFNLSNLAFKADDTDPDAILDFITQYIDRNKMYNSELIKKLTDIYTAIGWKMPNRASLLSAETFDFDEQW